MGEDQFFHAGFFRHFGCLFGSEVVVLLREVPVGLEVGAFTDKELGSPGEVDDSFTGKRIDGDGEHIPFLDMADLAQVDFFAVDEKFPFLLEQADIGALHAGSGEFALIKLEFVFFCDPPAQIVDAVVEEADFDAEMLILIDEAFLFDGVFDDLDRFVVDRPVAEAVEVVLAAGGIVAMDRMGHFIEVEAHEHGAEAEAMVAVEMADENAGHAGGARCWRK